MPPVGPQLPEDTLDGLTERIDMRQPLPAYASYQKIIESGLWSRFVSYQSPVLDTVDWLLGESFGLKSGS